MDDGVEVTAGLLLLSFGINDESSSLLLAAAALFKAVNRAQLLLVDLRHETAATGRIPGRLPVLVREGSIVNLPKPLRCLFLANAHTPPRDDKDEMSIEISRHCIRGRTGRVPHNVILEEGLAIVDGAMGGGDLLRGDYGDSALAVVALASREMKNVSSSKSVVDITCFLRFSRNR